jgi:hypothetical protein
MFRRKPAEPACRHSFDVTGVQHVKLMDPYVSREIPAGYQTSVLKVCAWCGTRRVETLEDQWTLEQVRGLSPTQQPSGV